ncbi:DUF3224 domain-containing protein [Aquihabitans sp. McL0605]|uniref:DUF3224 domain-containing protein n=1 Tax=Aquihabitans sp. McL0605 TaxID=3415671 RepID=UPI003CFA5BB0
MTAQRGSTAVDATFKIANWVEAAVDGLPEEHKITRATVTKNYGGDIDGTSLTEWSMAYLPGGSARFVGMERIEGTIAGRSGTVVLQHLGAFSDGVAKGSVEVVPGSGTDQLTEASGAGVFVADPAGTLRLDLTFA